MSAPRPAIPRSLRRDVEVEAGHRCAIPTCRSTDGLEVHHIEDWSKVRRHDFENLILLCSNCHSRATKNQIDRKAMRAYKANLSLTAGRYGDLERRVLENFVQNTALTLVIVDLSQELHLKYLIDDGLLVKSGPSEGAIAVRSTPGKPEPDGWYGPWQWTLTAGREFVDRMRTARQVG
jgi:hypothetical protein